MVNWDIPRGELTRCDETRAITYTRTPTPSLLIKAPCTANCTVQEFGVIKKFGKNFLTCELL